MIMKILIVRTIAIEEDLSQNTYNNQGIGLATQLTKCGNECALVYYAKKGKQREELITSDGMKIKIYHIEGINLAWNAIYSNKLYDICNDYDLIQTSECDQICSWELYKRFPNKTVIYHGPYKSKYTWKYNMRSMVFDLIFSWRKGFKNATVITKSLIAEKYLCDKGFKNIVTLGVGLNPLQFENKVDKLPSKIESIILNKGNNKYLLYVGAISKRKNLMYLLEVLDILVNEKKCSEIKMIVVGTKAYKEEKYYYNCFEFIKNKRLSNNIIYLGSVEQKYMRILYENSDVYLLATQYDIFGMVYLEALYFGTIIITTLCGGSSLLIEEGKTGYIRNLNDKIEWGNLIQKIINNKQDMNIIRENGKKLIRDNYLWSKMAPGFLEVYNDLLSR